MKLPIAVAIVDSQRMFRDGLAELLRTMADIAVVGEASCDNAVGLAETFRPDVLIIGLAVVDTAAVTIVRSVRACDPAPPVVVLAANDDTGLLHDLVDAGVSGFLLKTADRNALKAAITLAAAGTSDTLLTLTRSRLIHLLNPEGSSRALSQREVEVLSLLGGGMTNRAIAREMNISDGTVKRHLTNIYAKLGATSRVDAMVKGAHAGALIRFDDAMPIRA